MSGRIVIRKVYYLKRVIRESSRDIIVQYDVDVLIAGGGLAGSAAAITSARMGADTLLLDLHNAPGGMATFQGISGVTKQYYGPNGTLITGLLTELLERYARTEGREWNWSSYGYMAPGKTWRCYDTELMKLVLTEMLEEAGVRMLFNTWVSQGIAEDERMARGIIFENKLGRQAAIGKCIIDSTGDADVAVSLGVPMQSLLEEARDSFLFRVGNVDFQKTYEYLIENPEEIGIGHKTTVELWRKRLQYEWKHLGFFNLKDKAGSTLKRLVDRAESEKGFQREYLGVKRLDRLGIEGLKRTGIAQINTGIFLGIDNLNTETTTRAQIIGRKIAYYVVNQFLRPYVPGFEDAVIISTATELGVRTSRKISAEYNLINSRDLDGKRFPDVVGVFCTINPEHKPHQLGCPFLTEIPYRSLVPLKVENLVVASGRSFPNDQVPSSPYRDTPMVVMMGQAAGVAATLSAHTGISPRKLDVNDVQRALLEQGVYLGTESRLAELGLSNQ